MPTGFPGIYGVKPYRQMLILGPNSFILRYPFLDSSSNLTGYDLRKLHSVTRTCFYSTNLVGLMGVVGSNQTTFCSSGLSQGRSFLSTNLLHKNNKLHTVLANVVSDRRNHSNSVDSHVNDNSFEKIYLQGGFNLKPFVTESIQEDQDLAVQVDDINSYSNSSTNQLSREKVIVSTLKRSDSEVVNGAWKLLRGAIVNYCGNPVGTVAAADPADKQHLNYDQVFVRDFIPSALAFLLNGEAEIVKNFLLHTLQLQSWGKTVDCYSPGQGLKPASFKVRNAPLDGKEREFDDVLEPGFEESAIGRVAPVDSGLWWIILLRAYGKVTGDFSLQERLDVQTGMKLILNLCLNDGFDMFPTLLVADGSCMIDRRMGIHGHPLEIQALFYSALRCAREILTINDSTRSLVVAISNRLSALSFHIREYYWVDMKKINEIYRYKTEEYSTEAVNKFKISRPNT